METGQRDGTGAPWLVGLWLLLVAAVAVVMDAPSAAILLAGLCATLAALRAARRRDRAIFRARSRTFDIAFLVVATLALVVLAPAGYLT